MDGGAEDAPIWFEDEDGDGVGGEVNTFNACGDAPPVGYSADATDCDDTNNAIGSVLFDADCDGYIVDLDCDDTGATSTFVAGDEDCDGSITADDCNDLWP